MNSSILLLLTLALGTRAVPEAMLRNVKSPADSTYVAITSIASDNQQCLPELIKATEVCIKAGIWLFYPDTNFLSNSIPKATMIYTRDPTDPAMTCYSLPPTLDKKVGSFRLAGNPLNENQSSLNVYVFMDYAGTEIYFEGSQGTFPHAINSAIVTGAERWEFFMKEGFEGFSECTNANEQYIPDFTARFGVAPGDIKSARMGCSKPWAKMNSNHVFKGYN